MILLEVLVWILRCETKQYCIGAFVWLGAFSISYSMRVQNMLIERPKSMCWIAVNHWNWVHNIVGCKARRKQNYLSCKTKHICDIISFILDGCCLPVLFVFFVGWNFDVPAELVGHSVWPLFVRNLRYWLLVSWRRFRTLRRLTCLMCICRWVSEKNMHISIYIYIYVICWVPLDM